MSLHDSGRGIGRNAVASRVRGNAGSAGFGAACLIFFGFFYFSPPVVKDAFTFGDALATWTMRIGGVAMGAMAILSFTGKAWVLLIDGLFSVPIGISLAVAGVILVGNGGMLFYVLYPLFGWTFVSAGVRNVRAYSAIRREFGATSAMVPVPEAGSSRWGAAVDDVVKGPHVLLKKRAVSDDIGEISPRERVVTPLVASSEVPVTPPPSGYLASFAKKREDESSSTRPE